MRSGSSFGSARVEVQQYTQGAVMERSTKPRFREQVRIVIETTRITWCSCPIGRAAERERREKRGPSGTHISRP